MDERKGIRCPDCKSSNVHGRGKGKYQCQDCKPYFRDHPSKIKLEETITEENDRREITTVLPVRITTLDELISQCEIDTEIWEIERWICNKWEMGYADANRNPGQVPLFQVKVWLKKKVAEVQTRDAIALMIEDAKQYAPVYKPIEYPKYGEGMVYEIDMPDLHFGKLAWAEETGQDYDIQIATDATTYAFLELLSYVKSVPISKILLPLGNDFFNVNGAGETTVNGTKQMEDTRWQKTFRKGRQLLVGLIDLCAQVAPVDVPIIPGNHDRERMFYLGDALECWYHECPNVSVDNRAILRKYYSFGKNLIGFTHGSEEKFVRFLPENIGKNRTNFRMLATHMSTSAT